VKREVSWMPHAPVGAEKGIIKKRHSSIQSSNPLTLSKTSQWDLTIARNLTSEELMGKNVLIFTSRITNFTSC
jgi:hypothetical protein